MDGCRERDLVRLNYACILFFKREGKMAIWEK